MKKTIRLFLAGIGVIITVFCIPGCGSKAGGKISTEMNNPHTSFQTPVYADNDIPLVKTPAASIDVPESYTFVWMTDTQFYSESAPQIYRNMTRWISENIDAMNIKFVFHTGDVVNHTNDPAQWLRADAAMLYLDQSVPYSILAGNHDLTDSEDPYENFLAYFGSDRFLGWRANGDNIWFYQNGEAGAQIIDTGSQNYLVLALGVWPDEEMVAWADAILKEHSEIPAILTTHDYMNKDGTRSETGNRLFDEIVRKNPNVHLVLCGHNHNAEYRQDGLDDNNDGIVDRTVYQLLADYQETPNGGNGFMRLLTIDESEKRLTVSTYSPYLDQYNCFSEAEYPGKDYFEIDISDWF